MAMGERHQSPHRPVLYQEIIDSLAPVSPKHYLDCTAGAGGHTWASWKLPAPMVRSWRLIWIPLRSTWPKSHRAFRQPGACHPRLIFGCKSIRG